ncbi:hypothetical protein LCGC14_0962850 [marine sediment metagenome]|uniref:Helix-turn-helix domain-containing protein n=1 Tax=marine sediment metagenome TaxID=412755 RepID=A0A0F9P027_9ZZZZ
MATFFNSLRELALAATSQISQSPERNPDGLISAYEAAGLFDLTLKEIYLYVIAKGMPAIKLRHTSEGDEFLMFDQEQAMEWFHEGRYLDDPSGVWLDELGKITPAWRSVLTV